MEDIKRIFAVSRVTKEREKGMKVKQVEMMRTEMHLSHIKAMEDVNTKRRLRFRDREDHLYQPACHAQNARGCRC